MGDFGLLKQGWKWVLCQKQAFEGSRVVVNCTRDNLVLLIDRHWPMVSTWCLSLGRFGVTLLLHWRVCANNGFWSLIGLGSMTALVIMWSCFVSFSSTSGIMYALLGLGAAGAAIHLLGSTPGLLIVGSFGILIMSIYGSFWIARRLFIVGGYLISSNHGRLLIIIATVYAVYFINVRAGWPGVIHSLNLAFISNDLLIKLQQGFDGANEGIHSKEHKESKSVVEDFPGDCVYSPPTSEAENVTPSKSSFKLAATPNMLNVQKDAPSSRVLKAETAYVDEMERIINSSNHFEALGFPWLRSIDPLMLKKEYRRMAVLVHPDKNMGNLLASESFKKLQCAYECCYSHTQVLSDIAKKKTKDDRPREEESRRIFRRN